MTRPSPTAPAPSTLPPPSALQTLLKEDDANSSSPHPPHLRHLALQILHNLQHQHLWTDLRIHDYSPLPPDGEHETPTRNGHHGNRTLLARPMISGLPPQRLYIHPDEQIALLQAQKAAGGTGMGEVKPEREWVLPSHLREKWSLARFGEIFDGIGMVPPEDAQEDDSTQSAEKDEWRTTKRVLLATLDDDSTVVYYIVHDGIVKPRQN